MAETPTLPEIGRTARLPSIDLLRGLVMILMALDHARDFFGYAPFEPLDLDRTTPLMFMTRWITHFCAPVFVFLAGTGAYLWAGRGKTRGQLAGFLVTRGVWLIVLELTLVRWGWFVETMTDLDYSFVMVQVIWALGWSMIALSVLVFLPVPVIAGLGIVMIAGHNAFDGISPDDCGALAGLWRILHVQGAFQYRAGGTLLVNYPLVPWIGVMAAGYAFGSILVGRVSTPSAQPVGRGSRPSSVCLALGVLLIVAFIILRWINRYGDPSPWEHQSSVLFTAFAFVNTTKYPPSLDYLLMTLGPALVLLSVLGRLPRRALESLPARFIRTFGRVPLFFYVLHLYLLQIGAWVYLLARYGARLLDFRPDNFPPEGAYIGLAPVYIAWLGALVILYPACRWFAAVKQRRRDWWLGYL